MYKILRILVVAVALAASAGATMRATGALPWESLVVTASSLGQKALNDPAAFDFVEALTTEIGQRLAGTEAHRRAVVWAETRLKAAGLENVHSEPFSFPAWIRGAESAEIVGSVPQHLAVAALVARSRRMLTASRPRSRCFGHATICLRLLQDRSAAKSPW